jgi:hypothetical protein
VEEKEVILRALGHYQIHLSDEMLVKNSKSTNDALKAESQIVTRVIKKIHKPIERK